MGKPFPPNATLLRQKINCGNPRCGTCRGVRYVHGPYWYAYWWEAGRTRSAYVGKKHPGGAAGERESRKVERKIHGDPWGVLGISPDADHSTARRAYRRRAFETHPDRGGTQAEAVAVNRAWAEIRRAKGWR
jgi:DnaJ-like protein